MRDLRDNSFSLGMFYKRRIIRIFPALFIMLFVYTTISLLIFLPSQFARMAVSVSSAATSLSNVYFWQTTDYFGAAAESKPLLHTWSLGVEEQFYLLFPLLLMSMRRSSDSSICKVLWLLSVASGLTGLLQQALGWESAAFYLLPARAWELALGGLVALNSFPKVGTARIRGLISAVSLVTLTLMLFHTDARHLFPVPWAIVPCLSTALLIAYGEASWAGNILRIPLLRWIGRISYSTYLWHWPIITIYRLLSGYKLSWQESSILAAISIGAGAVSYYTIERPVSDRLRLAPQKHVLIGGATAVSIFCLSGIALYKAPPNWRGVPPEITKIERFAEYRDSEAWSYQYREPPCHGSRNDISTYDREFCLPIELNKENVVVLGDSHAGQIWRALAERFTSQNVMQASFTGCLPLLEPNGTRNCQAHVAYIYKELVFSGKVQKVVLAARWRPELTEALVKTIRTLRSRGISVVVFGPIVEYDGEFPTLLAAATLENRYAWLDGLRLRSRLDLDRKMEKIVEGAGGRYISLYRIECPDSQACMLTSKDGGPMHFDYGHYTLGASRDIVAKIDKI